MRKVYKEKRRTCGMCKPYNMGWEKRWKAKEAARLRAMDGGMRGQGEREAGSLIRSKASMTRSL